MPPFPPCETSGLINLCNPAPVLTNGSWFTMQWPNIIWYGLIVVLLLIGIFVPFPGGEVDTDGYEYPEV
jgi:hypothetical protein